MNVLVLNVGSSSLKFELIGTDAERIDGNRDTRLAGGAVERIGGEAVLSLGAGGRLFQRLSTRLTEKRKQINWKKP